MDAESYWNHWILAGVACFFILIIIFTGMISYKSDKQKEEIVNLREQLWGCVDQLPKHTQEYVYYPLLENGSIDYENGVRDLK